jgi:hypothetical protein
MKDVRKIKTVFDTYNKKMLQNGVNYRMISCYTNLSVNEIEKIKSENSA